MRYVLIGRAVGFALASCMLLVGGCYSPIDRVSENMSAGSASASASEPAGSSSVASATASGASAAAASSTSASASSSSADSAAIRLEPVSCAEWDQELAKHRGKIVVMDSWATWCETCLEELPQLVEIHRKYGERGVACMSVSVDEPDARTAALEKLNELGATFSNYVINDTEDAWWDKWNIRALPIVVVFNRDGTVARKFTKDDPDNQYSYDDVEKLVNELLAAES